MRSTFPQYDAYLRLMRLHQPVGIWLIMWPALWGIALASESVPHIPYMLLCIVGAIIARGAGCVINDIWDQQIDREVSRTKDRPLASGELTTKQALFFCGALAGVGVLFLSMMGVLAIQIGLLATIPIAIYPLMKRITYWPQLFLGFTLNIGVLIAYAAVQSFISLEAGALYLGAVFLTLGYDTLYAHQDKEDDAQIGVKSTALLLGDDTIKFVRRFYRMALILFAIAGALISLSLWFYVILLLGAVHLHYQLKQVDLEDAESCKQAFTSNVNFGWILIAAIIGGKLM